MSENKGSEPRFSQTGLVSVTTGQAEENLVTEAVRTFSKGPSPSRSATGNTGKEKSKDPKKNQTVLTIAPRLRSSKKSSKPHLSQSKVHSISDLSGRGELQSSKMLLQL